MMWQQERDRLASEVVRSWHQLVLVGDAKSLVWSKAPAEDLELYVLHKKDVILPNASTFPP